MTDLSRIEDYLAGIHDSLMGLTDFLDDIGDQLKGINHSLAQTPQESTVSGGARITEPNTLMQELEPYSDYLKQDQGKVYVTKWMPDKDETKGYWRAINDILKKRGWEWVKVEKPNAKDSHWRKK